MTDTVIKEYLQGMHARGIVPTEPVLAIGTLQRFHIEGDSPAKKNGWAILHLGDYPHGYFGSWRTGKKYCWRFKEPRTPEERNAATKYQAERQVLHKIEQENRHAQAAETAQHLLDQAVLADPQHPYLKEKQIMPHGILQLDDALLVPMFHGIALKSLQFIYSGGSKRFLCGGQVKGCRFILDHATLPSIGPKEVVICEGFATGATLKETYPTVVCAFTAVNLILVAKGIRTCCPSAKITIAADNDQWTEGNPGLTKARLAAGLIDGEVMWPNFGNLDTSDKPTDFNDFVRLGGEL